MKTYPANFYKGILLPLLMMIGLGSYAQKNDNTNQGASILNVQILYFKVNQESQNIKLDWEVLDPLGLAQFEIERSINGVDNFESIGFLTFAQYTGKEGRFIFLDEDFPNLAESIYYRIRIHLGERKELSPVKGVIIQKENSGGKTWCLYPNPSTDENIALKYVSNEQLKDQIITLRAFNSSNYMRTVEHTLDFTGTIKITQLFPNLPKGLIILEITCSGKTSKLKIWRN